MVGLGYVGLSLAVVLSKKFAVVGVDVSEQRVNDVNKRVSPMVDSRLAETLELPTLNLRATLNLHSAISGADVIILCTPTNFDKLQNKFDTQPMNQSSSKQ